ncbi:hypothetical protein [Rhodococcus sp. OK302]|uniref:hypothetical protein n=1 Tax=Rhodococcus sp. OK302 TaxID=1882769 RepID=UPI0020CD548F|nr:hypothetical protein [Rhodococcus sp. OK302]
MKATAEGIDQGIFRKGIAPEIFYRTVRDTLWSTTYWPDRQKYTTDECADLMITLVLSAFRATPAANASTFLLAYPLPMAPARSHFAVTL